MTSIPTKVETKQQIQNQNQTNITKPQNKNISKSKNATKKNDTKKEYI